MPNVNLTDSRSRDAVVKAETTGVDEEVRYVDEEGKSAYTRKILKATVDHDFETLAGLHDGDAEALGKSLIEGDPEVDMEKCGLFLWGVSRVYVDSSDGIVYRIEQEEIVRGPDGKVREKRSRERPEANVDSEIPLTWTGRKFNKDEAIRRFVFSSKLQIVHINGLTYDFLYGMAKELAESNSLMMVGGGSKGRDPLVFRRSSVPYRGFLEGRIDGEKYLLLLHLSNLELKVPVSEKATSHDKQEVPEMKKQSKSKEAAKPAKKDKPSVAKDKNVAKDKVKKKKAVAKKKTGSGPVEKRVLKDEVKVVKEKKAKKLPVEKSSAKDKPDSAPDESRKAKSKTEKKESTQSVATNTITSEDLGVWLKSIRMGKYLKLFVDNEIDVDVLTELTDDDLKELEIPLGSRRRFLKHVKEADNLRAEVTMAVNKMAEKSAEKVTSTKK